MPDDDPVIVPVVKKPSITLDAWVAIGIAALMSLSLSLSSKESYEYVNPYVRFWLILVVGMLVQAGHALAKFRDGKYQQRLDLDQRQAEADKTGKSSVTTSTVTPTVRP